MALAMSGCHCIFGGRVGVMRPSISGWNVGFTSSSDSASAGFVGSGKP